MQFIGENGILRIEICRWEFSERMIGMIGAMQVEVEDLLSHMQNPCKQTHVGTTFYSGQISGVDCVVAQSGVGKVAAAVCAAAMIECYHPQAVLCEGVAGGIGKDVHIGDLVVATKLVQYDMDTTPLGDPLGYLSDLKTVYLEAPAGLRETIVSCAREFYSGHVFEGIIATGDQFVADNQKFHEIAGKFGASACEMEGGAIAQACCMAGVEFAVLRTISDNGDDDASVDFPTFAADAAHKNTALLRTLLPQLAGRMEMAL